MQNALASCATTRYDRTTVYNVTMKFAENLYAQGSLTATRALAIRNCHRTMSGLCEQRLATKLSNRIKLVLIYFTSVVSACCSQNYSPITLRV